MLGGVAQYAWQPDVILKMLKMFRRIEYYWKYYRKTLPSMTSFFSYPGLIYNFIEVLGLEPPTSLLLKSVVLRQKQQHLYTQLLAYITTCESLNKE